MVRSSRLTIQWVASALLFGIVLSLSLRNLDLAAIRANATTAGFLAIIALQALYLLVDAVRTFQTLGSNHRASIPLVSWTHLFTVGRLLNQLIPQGGNVYRAVRLAKDWGITTSGFLASLAAATWLGIGVSFFLIGLLIAASSESFLPGLGVAAVGAGMFVALLLLPRITAWLEKAREQRPGGGNDRLSRMTIYGRELWAASPMVILLSIVMSVIGVLIYATALMWVEGSIDWVAASSIFFATSLATIISVTPGGLGIVEGSAGLAALVTNVDPGVAVLAAFLVRVSGLLATGITSMVTVRHSTSEHSHNGRS